MFLLVLTFSTLLSDRDVLRPAGNQGQWQQAATWREQIVPDKYDRVLIPGSPGQPRTVTVEDGGGTAFAATAMVGKVDQTTGTLDINGRLIVSGPNVDGETQAGRFFVGGPEAHGTVNQSANSSVVVLNSLRLAVYDGSTAVYSIDDADFESKGKILMAAPPDSNAVLKIRGGLATVQTRFLEMGLGNGRLAFEGDVNGVSELTVKKRATLAGTLRVSLDEDTPALSRIKLLNLWNAAVREGGFRRVMIKTPPGKHYELSYAGGAGNDIVLDRRSTPLVRFETWQQEVFAADDPIAITRPMNDPDADGVTNLGEYKLGCHPRIHEGPPFMKTIDAHGNHGFTFTERRDRRDVIATPQFSFDGRLWFSDGLTVTQASAFGNARTMRVTSGIPATTELQFRLHFQRLPDPGVRPHVLFVMIDDLNDWVESLGGHPQSLTPNLNAFAAGGTVFVNAYAPAPLCGPSRAAILSGVMPARSGVYTNSHEMAQSAVLANAASLPQHFRNNGYRAIGGGKIFHKAQPGAWDGYFPSLEKHRPDDPESEQLNGITSRGRQFDWGRLDVDDADMGDHQVVTWVNKKLLRDDGPTFLACGIYRPHLPFRVPQKYFNPWNVENIVRPLVLETDLDDVPEMAFTRTTFLDHDAVLDAGEWDNAVHSYLAAIRFADGQLGRVMAALDRGPMARNTIVVVTSDHGWQLGQKQTWRKGSLWEADTRAPLMIQAPGVSTPGSVCSEIVNLIDLYPTLTELAGFDEPAHGLDGTSLVPQLINPTIPRDRPTVSSRSRHQHAVRSDRWRYVEHGDGSEELYDHSLDPFEWNNLADDETLDSVKEDLRGWIPANPVPPVGS